MRKNAQAVAEAWLAGKPKRERTVGTDGRVVWSYNTIIALRSKTGQTFITNRKYSVTTSGHTNALRAHADYAKGFEKLEYLGGDRYRIDGKVVRVGVS